MLRLTDEPGDPDRPTVRCRDREHRHVVVLVHVRQLAEVRRGQPRLRGQEAESREWGPRPAKISSTVPLSPDSRGRSSTVDAVERPVGLARPGHAARAHDVTLASVTGSTRGGARSAPSGAPCGRAPGSGRRGGARRRGRRRAACGSLLGRGAGYDKHGAPRVPPDRCSSGGAVPRRHWRYDVDVRAVRRQEKRCRRRASAHIGDGYLVRDDPMPIVASTERIDRAHRR